MSRLSNKYIELGRGKKLVNNKYWHQFILGLNLSNEGKPFVVSEVENKSTSFVLEVSLEELTSGYWDELIGLSNCFELIKGLNSDNYVLNKFISSVKIQTQNAVLLVGDWVSKNKISPLDHDSNFTNWVEAKVITGHIQFSLSQNTEETNNCVVKIPVLFSGGEGSYSIHKGNYQLGYNTILIWQNNTFPIMIKYNLFNSVLNLELFGRKIDFVKA